MYLKGMFDVFEIRRKEKGEMGARREGIKGEKEGGEGMGREGKIVG